MVLPRAMCSSVRGFETRNGGALGKRAQRARPRAATASSAKLHRYVWFKAFALPEMSTMADRDSGEGTKYRGRPAASDFQGGDEVEVLDCLKKYGQRLDLEIAKETGVPLEAVRRRLAALAATGTVITCSLTRFEKGRRVDALQCRVSGYVPPRAPGPKGTPKPLR
jgi:hypothetical protein